MHIVFEGTHGSAAAVAGWRDTVIVIGPFSKAFGMMGWRVGFVLADSHSDRTAKALCESPTTPHRSPS